MRIVEAFRTIAALREMREVLRLDIPARSFRLRWLSNDLARLPLWWRVAMVNGIKPSLTPHEAGSLFPYQGDGNDEGWLDRLAEIWDAPPPPEWVEFFRSVRSSLVRAAVGR